MTNSFLKFKSKYYIFILGIIHMLELVIISACTSNGNNKNISSEPVFKTIEIKDSISKKNQNKDSLAKVKHVQDSIARVDSINNTKKKKNPYNPVTPKCMYGTLPNYNKKNM